MDPINNTARIELNVMKNKVQIGLITLVMVFLNANIFAQTDGWETELAKDGKTTVKSRISKRTDEAGDKVPLLEYAATTIANVSMENCIAVIKDVSKHKEFTDDETSEIVETISDNEWVVYYFTKSPWPMPDNDLVVKMIFTEDDTSSLATFTLTVAPSLYEMKDVKRMTYYNQTYAFKDLGNGAVEMTVTGKMSPTIKVPGWMMSAWFPNGPAKMLRIIAELANSI